MLSTKQSCFAAGLLLVAVVAASVPFKLYFIRDDSSAEILWNANEAYLFLPVTRRGFTMRYPQYAWALFMEYIGIPTFPNDSRASITVIRTSASKIERHFIDLGGSALGNGSRLYTPFEEAIYANCEGILCRWTGNEFAPATPEEQRTHGGITNLSATDFNNVNGWSRRSVAGTSGEHEFSIPVGSEVALRVRTENVKRDIYGSFFIDLARPGQTAEQLWHIDGHPHRVNQAEYENVFRGQ